MVFSPEITHADSDALPSVRDGTECTTRGCPSPADYRFEFEDGGALRLNMIDLKRVGFIAVISVALGAGIADAQCPYMTAAQGKSMSTAIFTGVATTITNLHFSQIVTFNNERVWQGSVGKELTAYQTSAQRSLRCGRPEIPGVCASSESLDRSLRSLFPGTGADTRLKIEEDKERLERIDLGTIGCLSGPADGPSGQRLVGELGPSHSPE
jgi:hypothetical protein